MADLRSPDARRWLDSPIVAIALPAIVSLILSIIPTVVNRAPLPNVQDEFAHLLAADTFARGRLTNPSPPLWPFFEAVHILVHPTYMSKYLPGLGLVLAFGQVFGLPILGAWLTSAAACGAIAWLLLGCVPARWALLGGLLAAGHPLLMWWSQTYWGGEVALLGGALLTGTALRLLRFDGYRQRWAWLAGIGCGLLLLTRPLEGGIVGVLLSATLTWISLKQASLRHVLRPTPIMALVLLATAAWLALFNYRVTGSPWQLPYTLAARQYMVAPLTYFQAVPPPPHYNNSFLAHFYRDYEWPEYAAQLTLRGFWRNVCEKCGGLWSNFARAWMLPLLPLLCGLLLIRRSRAALLSIVLVLGLPAIQQACTPWMRNQYMAPAVGGFFALMLLGYQQLARFSAGGVRVGQIIVSLLLAAQIAQTGLAEFNFAHPPSTSIGAFRQRLIDRLDAGERRKKLVLVRHLPGGSLSDLVYNSAEIDQQQIVYARDLGDANNPDLIACFKDREVWVLIFETNELIRYAPPTARMQKTNSSP